jgi:hypothetical protein
MGRRWRQAGSLSYEMGSFFLMVSYARGINPYGYRIIEDHKMGSFGNFSERGTRNAECGTGDEQGNIER